MKRWILSLALLALITSASGHAQQVQPATAVQQTATHADTATQVTTSATSAATLTLTPNSGESVYLHTVDISNCAGTSAAAAAVTTITTTNITGSPAWTMGSGATAGNCTQAFSIQYPFGVKSATPGTAVTFVLPTFATQQTIRLNVSWRSAP
jgi:hypothetical protein